MVMLLSTTSWPERVLALKVTLMTTACTSFAQLNGDMQAEASVYYLILA